MPSSETGHGPRIAAQGLPSVGSSGAGRQIFAFFLLCLFYWLTAPANLSEADDGYWYAALLEQFRFDHIEDSRNPLYFIVTHVLFSTARLFHGGIDGFSFLAWFSIATASGAVVLFYRYLRAAYGLSEAASLSGAAILAFSYGFWRYASLPEVYTPSIFLILAVLLVTRRFDGSADGGPGAIGKMALCGALAGIAVLLYRPISVILFMVYPLSVFRFGRIPALFAYGAAGVAVVLLGYLAMFANLEGAVLAVDNFHAYVFLRDEEFVGNDLSAKTAFLGVAAFVRMIVAGQWAFGLDWVVDALGGAISVDANNELYQARRAGWLPYLALGLIGPLVLAGAWLTALAVRHRRAARGRALGMLFVWWLLIGFAVPFSLVPSAYELYILPLPATAGLFALWLAEPVAAAGRRGVLVLCVALFGVFNWVGGLAVVDGPSSDYNGRISEWAVGQAKPGDMVVVEWKKFTLGWGIRHRTGARFFYEKELEAQENLRTLATVLASGRRVFALYRKPLQGLTVPWLQDLERAAGRPLVARLVHENDAGRTYEILPRPPSP